MWATARMTITGVVNPPVYHASTILFPTVAAMEAARTQRFGPGTRYGRYGTPTTFALEEALAEIEGGHRAMVLPSGLAAIAAAIAGISWTSKVCEPGDST